MRGRRPDASAPFTDGPAYGHCHPCCPAALSRRGGHLDAGPARSPWPLHPWIYQDILVTAFDTWPIEVAYP